MVDARSFRFSSDFPMDKISGFYPDSFAVSATSTRSVSIPHALGYRPLHILKWSTTPDFSTSYDEIGISFNLFNVSASTDAVNLNLVFLNNTASSVTFHVRVIYFMPPDVSLAAAATQPGLDTFNLNSDYNYPKILFNDKTIGANAVIAHGLGYYPQVELWYITASGLCVHLVENSIYGAYDRPNAEITSTDLRLSDGITTKAAYWYYRIYADEV